jgi:hypothetical protein
MVLGYNRAINVVMRYIEHGYGMEHVQYQRVMFAVDSYQL